MDYILVFIFHALPLNVYSVSETSSGDMCNMHRFTLELYVNVDDSVQLSMLAVTALPPSLCLCLSVCLFHTRISSKRALWCVFSLLSVWILSLGMDIKLNVSSSLV